MAQVSSMKTSRLGSMRPWRVFHRPRLRATPGWFCSLASTVFFEAEAFAADECPDGAVVDPQPAPGKFGHQAAQGETPAAVRATSHARWVPAIFGGTWPPILPGATLPVARSLCVHFTTLDGATLSARATFRTLSPAANPRHRAFPQIHRQRSDHRRRPPTRPTA